MTRIVLVGSIALTLSAIAGDAIAQAPGAAKEPNPFIPLPRWPIQLPKRVEAPPIDPAPMPPAAPMSAPAPMPPPMRGAAVYKPVGAPLDLSARLDPKLSVAGQWTAAGGVLSAARGGGDKRIALAAPPAAAYMWDLTFNRTDGRKQFCLMFPVAGNPSQVWIGGMAGQSSSIQGPRDPAAHNAQPLIKNNAEQKVRLVVVPNGDQCYVEVFLDGQSYLKYQGAISQLNVYRPYTMPDGTKLGLMSHNDSTFEFKQMKVYALVAQ